VHDPTDPVGRLLFIACSSNRITKHAGRNAHQWKSGKTGRTNTPTSHDKINPGLTSQTPPARWIWVQYQP